MQIDRSSLSPRLPGLDWQISRFPFSVCKQITSYPKHIRLPLRNSQKKTVLRSIVSLYLDLSRDVRPPVTGGETEQNSGSGSTPFKQLVRFKNLTFLKRLWVFEPLSDEVLSVQSHRDFTESASRFLTQR